MLHRSELNLRGAERISRSAMAVALGIHLLVGLEARGGMRLWLLIAVLATGLGAVNGWLTRLEHGGTLEWVENLRLVANLAGILTIGHYTRWCDPIWLWLPFMALLMEGSPSWSSARTGAATLAMCTLGLADGVAWQEPAGAAVLTLLCFVIVYTRRQITRDAFADLDATNARLDAALRDLKALHERALKTERLTSLGLLAAGMAHEINNPMSYVTSNLNSMAQDLASLPELPELLAEYRDEVLPATLDGVKRVNRIVADLRRFARGDPEAMVEFDVNAELEAACRIARSKFGESRRLEVQLGELPQILGRPQQITQVAMNLLVNAAQAVGPCGRVRLSSRADGDGIVFEVADDGAGMAPEVQAHLFEPFFTTKPVGEGTGLGLAVIHGIVSQHGGRIAVESAPGQGTRFTVRLPCVPPAPGARAAEPTPSEASPALAA